MEITYDKHGRMRYHPSLHFNQGKPWKTTDEKYLIDFYEKLGPEQISFDIGRTIHTVMTRAYELRKGGLMPAAKKNIKHKRMRAKTQQLIKFK